MILLLDVFGAQAVQNRCDAAVRDHQDRKDHRFLETVTLLERRRKPLRKDYRRLGDHPRRQVIGKRFQRATHLELSGSAFFKPGGESEFGRASRQWRMQEQALRRRGAAARF